jgi:hypothetical protein
MKLEGRLNVSFFGGNISGLSDRRKRMKSTIIISLLILILIAGSASAQDVFGMTGGAVQPLIMMDSNGTAVTFTLSGGGWGEVIGGPNFAEINLYDTTTASNFFIKTASRKETSVGDITVNGDLKSLIGKTVDLRGNITITGTIGKLQLDDVADDHTITIESPGDGGVGVSIKFDQVRDLTLDSNTPIKSLTVTEWIDSNGSATDELIASSIDAMRIKGDFEADLLLTGATDASKPTLKNGRIAGALNGAWEIDGDVGNLKMNRLLGDLEVYGDAQNIKTTDPLAITADDPPLGELYVDGYSQITCCKDRIKGSECTFYSRSEPNLYPLMDLCDYYDEGSWWKYWAQYKIGRKPWEANEVNITVTDVSGDCVEVSSSFAGQDVTYRWCTDGNSMSIANWVIESSDMDFTMNIYDTNEAPEPLRMKQTYQDTGTFDGTFSVYVSQLNTTISGTLSGTATATARLMGHEQVETDVDGGTTYMAAKVKDTLKLKGVMTFTYAGRPFRMGFLAMENEYVWGVPGIGLVKGRVGNIKVTAGGYGVYVTVSGKEFVDLIDYGPR